MSTQKQKTRYAVYKDGKPTVISFRDHFGTKAGVLVPTDSGTPSVFRGQKSADGAIARTLRIAGKIRGSVLDQWDKLQPVISPGKWEVKPLTT